MAHVKIYSSDYCPYCHRAKALLRARGVTDWDEVVVDGQPAVRAAMAQLVGRTSVPQIFINGQHIGGSDELAALEQAGKLDALLAQPG